MILIVDNHPEEIAQFSELFETSPFKIDSALSGHEALKKIINYTYHLILLKIQLSDISGFEVAETIKGLKKVEGVPIFFISNTPLEYEDIAKAYRLGGWDCLIEPIDKMVLYHKLSHAIHLNRIYTNLKLSEQLLSKELAIRKQAEENSSAFVQLRISKLSAPLASLNNRLQLILDAVKQGHEEQAIDLLVKSSTQLKKLDEYLKSIENPLLKKHFLFNYT